MSVCRASLRSNMVINMMKTIEVEKGETVLRQGEGSGDDSGDCMYVVQSGTCDIFRKDPPPPRIVSGTREEWGDWVQTRARGDIFGELALLYNLPRQATVVCTSEGGGKLWALERAVYVRVVQTETDPVGEAIDAIRHIVRPPPLQPATPHRTAPTAGTHACDRVIVEQGIDAPVDAWMPRE